MYLFTEDCLIGVTEIDEEHKHLFQLIADTNAALQQESGGVEQALLLINELKQYAATHFAHEEAYMESIHDAELNRQRKEHQSFITKIDSYKLSEITETNAASLILELLEYLSKWLMGHILGSDILIGHFKQAEKPAIPVFDDSFKTGIALVDEEHKTLFDIIGRVHTTIETDLLHDKYDAILDIIGELRDYTHVHFSDEEAYMASIQYDGLENQKLLHQKFIDKLNELNLDDVDENQEAYLYDFLTFLQNWLINHILKVDKLIPQA